MSHPLCITPKVVRNSHRRRLVYTVKAAARLLAYFQHLRETLDNEQCAALIVDCESGFILSSNLLAYELFEIDPVSFQFVDLMVDPTAYREMVDQLLQSGNKRQSVLLHNADGQLIDCAIAMTIAPHYSEWMIFRISKNQQLSDISVQVVEQ